jgi:transposase
LRVIAPLLPNKPRRVARVDDQRVLKGIFWVLRPGSPRRDETGLHQATPAPS